MFSVNDPTDVKELADWICQYGVESEIEVFDVGMSEQAFVPQKSRVLRGHLRLFSVLGISGGVTADPRNLMHLVSSVIEETRRCGPGIGRFQLSNVTRSNLLGGEARAGLEDAARRNGELAKSNARLVQLIKEQSSVRFQVVIPTVQSHSLLLATPGGTPTIVGNDVTVGHRVTLHGCNINDRLIVGVGAIILDGAEVGEDSIIGAGFLLPEKTDYLAAII
jgi:3-keto-5-aminohexanoate cleavage enzyme